ncbi:LpqN/LpqT family lipoprotein [Speluncibacter jeojiensis]|uniref:LpqN/LpqT family lipoprotein n=1 Tax=Speluncibacter jeojiensis TaxID=2710754 RepID=A0A9X4LYK5_9ACTN|nr:LpqN/LpqT family lipoprotein [Corynebacteriales bacterium D3-21]
MAGVQNPAAPTTHTVLVNPDRSVDGWSPNGVLLHGVLAAAVDSYELLDCAFADSRMLPGWHEQNCSRAPFLGSHFASIRGTYEVGDPRFAATTRYLLSEYASAQYLTQLTVTVMADQLADLADDVDVISSGLRVS